mmetsp:Transcript_32440/g.47662  ORF Transcript_32440/g.47662 Transcript_32440/m.47662 type:complete len:93 (+) Transcript_32440:840-1118(+)|eukprot:4863467-Ditylum_brightwellii.AAC.1
MIEKPTKKYPSAGTPAHESSGYPGITNRVQTHTNAKQFICRKSLVRTGGNALKGYDRDTMADLLRVTVPQGCMPSQTIEVTTPDSSERFAYT